MNVNTVALAYYCIVDGVWGYACSTRLKGALITSESTTWSASRVHLEREWGNLPGERMQRDLDFHSREATTPRSPMGGVLELQGT